VQKGLRMDIESRAVLIDIVNQTGIRPKGKPGTYYCAEDLMLDIPRLFPALRTTAYIAHIAELEDFLLACDTVTIDPSYDGEGLDHDILVIRHKVGAASYLGMLDRFQDLPTDNSRVIWAIGLDVE
jgi:hypothetical protein